MNLEPILQSEVSQKEKDIIYECIYMESRKMVLKDLFAGQQWKNRNREQTYGHGKRGGEGEMHGKRSLEKPWRARASSCQAVGTTWYMCAHACICLLNADTWAL